MLRTLGLALLLDELVGEPPASLHPVVWIGRLLDGLEALAPQGRQARLVYGLLVATAVPAGWAGLAAGLARWTPWPIQAAYLSAAFAGRGLLAAAERVESALREGRLDDARCHARWLVSRPTSDLDAELLSAATIESLAENLVDSWVAPLLAYAGLGLGGAYLYRATNTADAMWGYRTPRYEQLGKGVARADDLLSWLPARLAAVLLILAGPDARRSRVVWRRDARRTASPNAGQTMAAMAGALGVRLEKRGAYVLYPEGAAPGPDAIARGRRLVRRAMLLAAALALTLRWAVVHRLP